jgi:hypothetical protein
LIVTVKIPFSKVVNKVLYSMLLVKIKVNVNVKILAKVRISMQSFGSFLFHRRVEGACPDFSVA